MKRTFLAKVIDVLITLAIIVAISVALLWFVHSFNVFDLPDFIDSMFGSSDHTPQEADEYEKSFLELIESSSYAEDAYDYIKLDKSRALELLASVEPVSEFFWHVETVYSYKGANRSQQHRIYKKGDRVRVDTSDVNIDTTSVFDNGITVTVNNETGEKREFSGDTEFVYTNLINIAAVEYALDSSDVEVIDVAIVEIDEEKYLYAEIAKNGIDGKDKYFISLDCGLVLIASSTLSGVEYFSQRTVSLDHMSTISDRSFDINGSSAEGLPTPQ